MGLALMESRTGASKVVAKMVRIRPPAQRPLSIFLLKEGVEDFREAVRNPNGLEWLDVDRESGVVGVVALRPQTHKTPWWTAYLRPHLQAGELLEALANRSTSAVLFIEVDGRRFAFAFGFGRHLLDPDAYEHDFGLKVVVNTVAPDRLMSVDARTFDELTMHTRRDVSQGSGFGVFGLDVTRDLVRSVTGPPQNAELGARATGSDSLSLLSRAQVTELPALCQKLQVAYASDDYKERFRWIDHLRRVTDPSLIARLNERLVAAIRSAELIDMHLAPPEPIAWARLDGFTYSTVDSDERDPDPRISTYLDSLDELGEVELGDLKRDRVIAASAETDQPLDDWPVYRCIIYEVREDEVLYALSAGQWYRVDAAFAEEVIRFAAELPELAVELPEARSGVREEDYNAAAAEAAGAICLDQQLVATPTGDRIELCDLLTRDRHLIHVKKRGSSSTLSHLFSQGLVAGELLVREQSFRSSARELVSRVNEQFAEVVPDQRPIRDEWEIAFVVLTRSQRETPLTLPFFSLVNLRSAVLRLRDLGYRVSVRAVPEV